jgi:drug/metabolite transporter (DMT)-like permease
MDFSNMKNIHSLGASLILTVVALVGASSVLISDVVSIDPAINFTFWSWVLVAIFIFPFAIKKVIRQWSIIKSHWKLLTALAFFGASLCSTTAVQALHKENLINAGLINGLAPIFIVLLMAICYRKWIGALKITGIFCGFAAVVLLVLGGNVTNLKHMTLNIGDVWMLTSVLSWSIYSVLLKKLPKSLSMLSLLFVISVLGIIFLFPFTIWEILHGKKLILGHTSFRGLMFTAIGTYIIGYLGWNKGVSILGPERSGFYLNLFPVFSMILSVIFFHTIIHWYDIVSLGLILLGLLLVNKK